MHAPKNQHVLSLMATLGRGEHLNSQCAGSTRVLEAAILWSENPYAKALMLAKKPLKFTFCVNNHDGLSYELAQIRSVSKHNPLTIRVDWLTHGANELEWGWGK